jgi:hypothetical protein
VKELKEFMAAHPGTIFDEYERDITAEAFFDLMKTGKYHEGQAERSLHEYQER